MAIQRTDPYFPATPQMSQYVNTAATGIDIIAAEVDKLLGQTRDLPELMAAREYMRESVRMLRAAGRAMDRQQAEARAAREAVTR